MAAVESSVSVKECAAVKSELFDLTDCLGALRSKMQLLELLSTRVNAKMEINQVQGKVVEALNGVKNETPGDLVDKTLEVNDISKELMPTMDPEILHEQTIEHKEQEEAKLVDPSMRFIFWLCKLVAQAAALAISSRSLLLLVDDDPALILKRNTVANPLEPTMNLSTQLFPYLVDLHSFLHQFRATLTAAARKALAVRVLSSVREFHEYYNPLASNHRAQLLYLNKRGSVETISSLKNQKMSPEGRKEMEKCEAPQTLGSSYSSERKASVITAPAPIDALHARESHPIIKHMLSHTVQPKLVSLPEMKELKPATTPKSSLAQRRMPSVELTVNTARLTTPLSSISTTVVNVNQLALQRRNSGQSGTLSLNSSEKKNPFPSGSSAESRVLPRVHGMIQASRFLLINGLFSDDWRLLVPTRSVATLYTGQLIPPILLDTDVRPLRFQPPELVLQLELNANISQDVFSLGLVLFEILTGSQLFITDFDARNAYETTLSVCAANPLSSKKAAEYFIDKYVRARLNVLNVDDKKLRDFLYRLLQWQPQARPSLSKMAGHSFFSA